MGDCEPDKTLEEQALTAPKEPIDFDYTHCPNREFGANGDADKSYSCLLNAKSDADNCGWSYNECNFSGKNYQICPRMVISAKILEALSRR